MLKEKIVKIKQEALTAIEEAKNVEEILQLEIQFLGRKSEFVGILRQLKDVSVEEKREVGQLANNVKVEIQTLLEQKKKKLASTFDAKAEKIDVTIPAVKLRQGHLHPLTKIQNEIEDIFTSMGFEIADGPEVEDEFHNFDALNMPKDHPARDMQDTFWLKLRSVTDDKRNDTDKNTGERLLLRTHTSNVQIRYMETHQPPFRIIAPGRIYRNEASDSTHEHTFHQFEALVVGDEINVGNFKFIAQEFFSKFFKKEIQIRIRPSFFPFTEPSFEFDISCTVCGGKGCSACKNAGWLEIGGAGMVNQNVFVAAGYPRGKYQGFAWGFGMERLAMMKYKIDDIRHFHGGDLRFIKQF
jgi:phenylalanyl-tRNA synthetase alpha chain